MNRFTAKYSASPLTSTSGHCLCSFRESAAPAPYEELGALNSRPSLTVTKIANIVQATTFQPSQRHQVTLKAKLKLCQ